MPVPEVHTNHRDGATWALTVGLCVVFLTYAGCFLYFFVDDEAIPLVYARNLLRGRGLVYTILEGRVEGYSDFLHVLWSAVLLRLTQALGLSRLAPLVVGKMVSLAAGTAIIVFTGRLLAQLDLRPVARAGALAFLALAGPLAVWSASSLETALFALTVLAFAIVVWNNQLAPAVVISILVTLERIDGPIYLAAVILGVVAARPRQWRALVPTTALAVAVVVAFHVWRFFYFGSLLSAPMVSKVLFRVNLPVGAMVKLEDQTYFQELIAIYGWPALAVAAAAIVALRHAAGRMAVVIVLILGFYAERVDDWMFGWRFAVAMLPFVAIVIAIAVDRLPGAMATAAAVCLAFWSLASAAAFVRTYQSVETRPIFWLAPRAGEAAWLGRYYELLSAARPLVHHGDRIAFNQAGIVPYMLDAENIDDLGICSQFIAKLPTTDVYYTAVGRYSPVTDAPILRTAHAYMLHDDVRVLIEPRDLIVKANEGRVPDVVLDGAFERVPAEGVKDNVIYRRTAKPMSRFVHDPTSFTENVSHASRLVRVAIDGHAMTPAEAGRRLPFMRELGLTERFTASRTYDLGFAQHDEPVSQIYVRAVASSVPGTLTIALHDETGHEAYRTEIAVGPRVVGVMEPVPPDTGASSLSLAFHAPGESRLTLDDVRVEGQSEALRSYVRRHLRFSAAGW